MRCAHYCFVFLCSVFVVAIMTLRKCLIYLYFKIHPHSLFFSEWYIYYLIFWLYVFNFVLLSGRLHSAILISKQLWLQLLCAIVICVLKRLILYYYYFCHFICILIYLCLVPSHIFIYSSVTAVLFPPPMTL